MTPLASGHGTLFDRLVARTTRPERATALPSAPAPVFDPFAAPREEAVERIAGPPRSAAASDIEHAFDGSSAATTANADGDDQAHGRMPSESRIGSPRRPAMRSHRRAIVDPATAHRAFGVDAAGDIALATTVSTAQRTRVSTTAIHAEARSDEGREPRQGSERRYEPDAATGATAANRGAHERLGTIRPALDRWATFDDWSSPDDAGTGSRAAGRGVAIVPPSSGRAWPATRGWPDADERSSLSVVRPDLPIAIPPGAPQAAPALAAREPIVHVTIGRLEIRASDKNTPLRSRQRSAAAGADAASASLDQYLASRRGGAL